MTQDYKLIITSDSSKTTQVRYRKRNDPHWQTLDLGNKDPFQIVEGIVEALSNADKSTST